MLFPMFNDFFERSVSLVVVERKQGCQMVYFPTKNPNLGKFKRAFDWKMSTYFKDIWDIL
jgi:hypothetical protein